MSISNRRQLLRFLTVGAAIVAASAGHAFAGSRTTTTLDDGASITVDNYSASRSDSWAQQLARLADRSTQHEDVSQSYRGLIPSGSRIFVNDNYLAWFYQSYLLGVWTIDSNGNFMHRRVGPSGQNKGWAHNEMIRGSDSPQGQVWFWDIASAGIEHSMAFGNGDPAFGSSQPNWKAFLTHVAGYTAYVEGVATGWSVIADGGNGSYGLDGVVYATSTLLAFKLDTRADSNSPWVAGSWTRDAADGTDVNGVQNSIESQVGFVCRTNDIKVIWRFKPSASTIDPYLVFHHMWQNYSLDSSGQISTCAQNSALSPSVVWGQPAYFKSNHNVVRQSTTFTAGSVYSLNPGTHCDGNAQFNYATGLSVGDYITVGENSGLAAGTPKWTLTHLAVDTGFGTAVPQNVKSFGNESNDGVWGFGGGLDFRGGPQPTRTGFSTSDYHVVEYSIATK